MSMEKGSAQEPAKGKVALSPVENLACIAASAQAISNAADTILRTAGAKHGLADWALLQRLSPREPQPMGRLAAQLGVTRQRIQKQIDVLAGMKLVDVQVTEADKRARNIRLTRQGAEALSAIAALWAASLTRAEIVAEAENLDGVRRRLEKVRALIACADLKAVAGEK